MTPELLNQLSSLTSTVGSFAEPVHIVIDNPEKPWLKILPICIAGGAVLLSTITFFIGYAKRVRERKAAWYHKVVVDHCLSGVFGLFATADRVFGSPSGSESTGRKTIPRKYSVAMAEFSDEMIKTQNAIYERLLVFDEGRAESLIITCEDLQDEIGEWFQREFITRRDNPTELKSVLLNGERKILNLLYECEFKNF